MSKYDNFCISLPNEANDMLLEAHFQNLSNSISSASFGEEMQNLWLLEISVAFNIMLIGIGQANFWFVDNKQLNSLLEC